MSISERQATETSAEGEGSRDWQAELRRAKQEAEKELRRIHREAEEQARRLLSEPNR